MVSYTGPMGGSLLSIGSPALGAGVGGDSGVGGVFTSSPISNMQASYGYGPLGQLITSTASTVSPGGGNVAPPAVPSGSHSTTMSWNTASSIPEAISVNGYFYLYAGGLPMEQISQNGTILYYLHNRQGSTIGLVDSSGQLVASYGYSPYGTLICEHSSAANQPVTGYTSSSDTQPPKPTPPSPPGGSSCQVPQAPNLLGSPPSTQPSPACIADSIAANHFLYDGQYLDTVSGLYYLRARWYDPATGQFISVDALVGITDQPYEYVGGDPVNLTDLLGLLCLSIHCIFNDISSVAGAASAVTALIPGLEGVSEMAGIIAFATKLVSCVTGHCNYAVLALDVLALIPGGAALKFANQADRDEAELIAVRALGKVDPSLESDLGYQKLLDKLSGYTSSALSTISLIPTRGRSHHYNHSHCIG